jgi:hypothetical protein
MIKGHASQPRSKLRTLGSHQILLTEAESRCFYAVRHHQRRALFRSLTPWEVGKWRIAFQKLGWSSNPLVLAVQALILAIAFVPMCLWLLVKCSLRWFLFPFRYLGTFLIPRDLKAPGEKTLVGIHNAFGRYINLSAGDYVACINDWIKILYGDETLARHNLENLINIEAPNSKNRDKDIATAMRSLLSVSREKLSKELGHYGRVELH